MPGPDVSGAPRQADGARLFEPPPALPVAAALAWCALDERALLRVDGADAESFLQGQLTQDISRLAGNQVLYAAHCSPKGRITALFLAWQEDAGYLLDLPGELGAPARRRLSMYLLRAKAAVRDAAADWQRTALAGSGAAAQLSAAGLELPQHPGLLTRSAALRCLRLGPARWLVLTPPGQDGGLRERLAAQAPPDPAGWQLACLRDGAPEVVAATADAFIPQMLNLDHLDGISFRKGCYTGQEIVARTHYLGRVKRRMRRFGWRGGSLPAPGSQLALEGGSAGDDAAQAQVVWALATGPDGGEALAVAVSPESDGVAPGGAGADPGVPR